MRPSPCLRMRSLAVGQWLVCRSGASYRLQRVLYERDGSECRLWTANNSNGGFVVKTVYPHQYEKAWRIRAELSRCLFIRKPVDGADKECALVYPFATEDLLSSVRNQRQSVPKTQLKTVLSKVLTAIRDLHRSDWTHGDIKPSNILVTWRRKEDSTPRITEVVLSDTEDAVKILEDECLDGFAPGNIYWRSPEANFGNNINRKTDIFSFGSVLIYALSTRVVFAYDALQPGQSREMAVLTNQLNYFGHTITPNFLERFDDAVAHRIEQLIDDIRIAGQKPFASFAIEGIDAEDRRFIERIMRLDPKERPEAEELLQDRWWDEVVR